MCVGVWVARVQLSLWELVSTRREEVSLIVLLLLLSLPFALGLYCLCQDGALFTPHNATTAHNLYLFAIRVPHSAAVALSHCQRVIVRPSRLPLGFPQGHYSTTKKVCAAPGVCVLVLSVVLVWVSVGRQTDL